MRFEVTIQETTQTFVFSNVQLPGTADLYSAIQEAQGYRDETLSLKNEVEEDRQEVANNTQNSLDAAAIATQKADLATQKADQAGESEQNALTHKNAAEAFSNSASLDAQEASESKALAVQAKNDTQALKEIVDTKYAEVLQKAIEVENDRSEVADNTQIVAADKVIVQNLRDEVEDLYDLTEGRAVFVDNRANDAANSAGQATQVSFGGATGIDGVQYSASIRSMGGVLSGWSYARPFGSSAIDRSGLIQLLPPNTPTFRSDGLYVGGNENLLVRTRDMNNGNPGWGIINTGITNNQANQLTAQNNANLLTSTSSGVTRWAQNITGVSAGQQYTYTVRVRRGNQPTCYVLIGNSGESVFRDTAFNFDTLTFTSTPASYMVARGFNMLRDGWFELWFHITIPDGQTTLRVNTSPQFGATGNTVFVFGPSVVRGHINNKPYVENTGTSPIVSNLDSIALIGSRYNQTSGTFLVRARALNNITQTIFLANDGTANNQLRLSANGTLTYTLAGVTQTITTAGDTADFSTWGITYTPTRIAISRNGAAVMSLVITGNIPVTNINANPDDANSSKVISDIFYWPTALSDAGLIVRTNRNLFYGLEANDLTLNADLGELAFWNRTDFLASNTPQVLAFSGSGAQIIHQFQFPYPFRATLTSSTGATTATLQAYPAGQDFFNANTDYTFTYNAPTGRMAFLRITPLN